LSDVSVVFASAAEATNPIVASDSASARSFFIFLSPIVQKLKARHLLHFFEKFTQESLAYFE
jgi:hypothetical protein